MTETPTYALDKYDYICAVTASGRPEILRCLHRLGIKQGRDRRTTLELAELLWYATAPTRERNRAAWEVAHQ